MHRLDSAPMFHKEVSKKPEGSYHAVDMSLFPPGKIANYHENQPDNITKKIRKLINNI